MSTLGRALVIIGVSLAFLALFVVAELLGSAENAHRDFLRVALLVCVSTAPGALIALLGIVLGRRARDGRDDRG